MRMSSRVTWGKHKGPMAAVPHALDNVMDTDRSDGRVFSSGVRHPGSSPGAIWWMAKCFNVGGNVRNAAGWTRQHQNESDVSDGNAGSPKSGENTLRLYVIDAMGLGHLASQRSIPASRARGVATTDHAAGSWRSRSSRPRDSVPSRTTSLGSLRRVATAASASNIMRGGRAHLVNVFA